MHEAMMLEMIERGEDGSGTRSLLGNEPCRAILALT